VWVDDRLVRVFSVTVLTGSVWWTCHDFILCSLRCISFHLEATHTEGFARSSLRGRNESGVTEIRFLPCIFECCCTMYVGGYGLLHTEGFARSSLRGRNESGFDWDSLPAMGGRGLRSTRYAVCSHAVDQIRIPPWAVAVCFTNKVRFTARKLGKTWLLV